MDIARAVGDDRGMPKKFDPSRVKELERRLVSGKDFADVMTYFFDHFADNRAFSLPARKIEPPEDLKLFGKAHRESC